MSGCIING